ncbi:hypothetical protein CSIM01_00510 [Colletotrichum simmondsii]|uniref:Uncharacterized protein n=1 Tax=Colletotrichum simmondsii TaxID=703756 RepID=A0A135SIU8_9PEZI|nr:hypothetical protein CSIM01_00510 [Colletotrichum simmondsii]
MACNKKLQHHTDNIKRHQKRCRICSNKDNTPRNGADSANLPYLATFNQVVAQLQANPKYQAQENLGYLPPNSGFSQAVGNVVLDVHSNKELDMLPAYPMELESCAGSGQLGVASGLDTQCLLCPNTVKVGTTITTKLHVTCRFSIPQSVPPSSSCRIESLLGLSCTFSLEMAEYQFVIGLRCMAAKPRNMGKKLSPGLSWLLIGLQHLSNRGRHRRATVGNRLVGVHWMRPLATYLISMWRKLFAALLSARNYLT